MVNGQPDVPHWEPPFRHTGEKNKRNPRPVIIAYHGHVVVLLFFMFSHVIADPYMQSFFLVISTTPCYIVALPTGRRQKTINLFDKSDAAKYGYVLNVGYAVQSGFNH